ncbi:PepSY domain-containing protein [Nonomuraea sp. NPDC046570]|uniref:PepSY domain-containing protein n=1 Tax=Nonomuraea sp. NPDC046570 TaxID=3155255 RepID=UPI003409DBE6
MRLTLIVLASLALISGCGGGGETMVAPTPTPTPKPTVTPSAISLTDAAKIAGERGKVVLLQLAGAQPPPVWLAAVYQDDGTLVDLRISVLDGRVTGEEPEQPADAKEAERLLAQDRTGLLRAADLAAKTVEGATLTRAQLMDVGGRAVWEVETVTPQRVISTVVVDAATGEPAVKGEN